MATLSTIPYDFIWDNYFVLSHSINSDKQHVFKFTGSGRKYKEHRVGSIAENMGVFTNSMAERIRKEEERICNLYEIFYENEMECAFFEKIAKDWIFTHKKDEWISRIFRTNEDNLADGNINENDLLVVQRDNRSPLAQQLVTCRYTLSDERNCSLLARLATQWSYVKDLYKIQKECFHQPDGVDVNAMIRSFVNDFVEYKNKYDEIQCHLGRSSSETDKILRAFKCRYEYRSDIEPSEKSMLAENFDIDRIGEKFVVILKQCENLLEYQKIIEGPYSALAESIKHVKDHIDRDRILFENEFYNIIGIKK